VARYPSAEWAPVAWMNALRHTRKTQLTVHITAGENDPRTIATWRNGQAGANFVIFRDGRTVQLADSACKSAADYGATHTISVECVGKDGPLTAAQVAALKRLILNAHELDGVPLRLAATSSDAGIGWHRLGVDGNFPHGRLAGRLQRSPLGVKTSGARGKACPTDAVIDQIHDQILPELTIGEPAAPAAPTPALPEPKPEPEEYTDMARNAGVFYKPDGTTVVYLVFNTESGWYHEFGNGKGNGPMPGGYNNALAGALDTPSWAQVTKGHADVIKRGLAAVLPKVAPADLTVTIADAPED